MPWQEESTMQLRRQFVQDVQSGATHSGDWLFANDRRLGRIALCLDERLRTVQRPSKQHRYARQHLLARCASDRFRARLGLRRSGCGDIEIRRVARSQNIVNV